jgi:hypothetical protein
MADLAVGDVTYTILDQRIGLNSRRCNRVRLAFGDGALTVPANGIPISKGKLGCPNIVESMVVVDQGTSGYVFQYDQSAEKLVVMRAPAQTHAHDLKIIGGQAAASTAATAYYATDIFGKEAATDKTIAKADSATKGGVLSETLAAAALSEASAVAIAAQTIEVEVIGW